MLIVILLVAFALRVVRLNHRPLWWDEGLSAYLVHQGPLTMIREMQATNHADPPVYLLALNGWETLAGSSPFALRYFSALMGLVSVALTWTVGGWLASQRTALLAALFVALAPMQVYYAREAKGYTFATACALLSTYAWGRKLQYQSRSVDWSRAKSQISWWIVYVVSTAAAIGTHYYLGALVLWQGCWMLGGAVIARRQGPWTRSEAITHLKKWGLAMAAVGLLLAPLILPLFSTTVRGVTGVSKDEALPLWRYLGLVGEVFGAGPVAEGAAVWIASGGLALLGVVGALTGETSVFLLSWIGVPLAAAFLVQSAFSFFHPRFLLYLGPVYYLLVSRGVARLRGASAIIPVALVLALCIPNLAPIYTRSVDEAEDPRPVAAHIRALDRSDDALVYVYIWQAGYLFSHYPQNELGFYRAYYTPQTVGAELETIFDRHPRLWLLSYRIGAKDANNLSGSWLEQEAYRVESTWYGRHNLALYLAPDFHTPGVGPARDLASFDGRVELSYPLVDARLRSGDALALPLRWRALTALSEDYSVFVHLSLPGEAPLAQSDGPLQTSTWGEGQQMLDRRALLLPPGTPPGRYTVNVGLYRPSDGIRLPLDGAGNQDALPLGYVEVGR
jgi:MFS family permease